MRQIANRHGPSPRPDGDRAPANAIDFAAAIFHIKYAVSVNPDSIRGHD
jgi:hypothetical protein